MDKLIICDTSIARGERRIVELALPPLITHTDLHMPVHVIRGKRPGPRLLVCAALHGDEINGVEIIRRVVGHKATRQLRGDLVAIPIVNVYGFLNRSRYLPDRRDLNRCFPGSEHGSMASRLAYLFMQEVVSKCTHGIDLHTAAIHRDNLPQVRAYLDDEATRQMAEAFHAPVLLDARLQSGTVREAASELGIPWLVYEAGEALRFDEVSIRAGVLGIIHVMRVLGMLPMRKSIRARTPRVARKNYWVRAPQSGILRSSVALGALVSNGDLLGYIADPYGENESTVRAPSAGIIIGRTNLPLVQEGEAVFHIAQFRDSESVAEMVEAFQSELDTDDQKSFGEAPII